MSYVILINMQFTFRVMHTLVCDPKTTKLFVRIFHVINFADYLINSLNSIQFDLFSIFILYDPIYKQYEVKIYTRIFALIFFNYH